MRSVLVTIGALVLALGLACTSGAAPTMTPAPPTPTPTPPSTATTQAGGTKEAPGPLKAAQEAMSKVKSYKMRGQVTFTPEGTPVAGAPTGTYQMSAEFNDKNYHFVTGDFETMQVDNVVYMKQSKDSPWEKVPSTSPEETAPQSPAEALAALTDAVPTGAEPCPSGGGSCQVITASRASQDPGIKATEKLWVGQADGLIYKYEISEVTAEGKTLATVEVYDYNVPNELKAPIP